MSELLEVHTSTAGRRCHKLRTASDEIVITEAGCATLNMSYSSVFNRSVQTEHQQFNSPTATGSHTVLGRQDYDCNSSAYQSDLLHHVLRKPQIVLHSSSTEVSMPATQLPQTGNRRILCFEAQLSTPQWFLHHLPKVLQWSGGLLGQ